MNPVVNALILVAFPVAAGTLGAALAAFVPLGAKVTSAVQHFAAGVVFAALAGEVLPDLRREGNLPIAVVSFLAGVGVLMALARFSEKREARSGGGSPVPAALVVLVGIDFLIDGALVGVGVTLGAKQGLILTIALTLEILFLAMSVSAGLVARGAGRRAAVLVPSLLGLVTVLGAVGGTALLAGAPLAVQAGVLAFGAAALLYLVTEELLVEAHSTPETPMLAGMFFVGFIVIYALAA